MHPELFFKSQAKIISFFPRLLFYSCLMTIIHSSLKYSSHSLHKIIPLCCILPSQLISLNGIGERPLVISTCIIPSNLGPVFSQGRHCSFSCLMPIPSIGMYDSSNVFCPFIWVFCNRGNPFNCFSCLFQSPWPKNICMWRVAFPCNRVWHLYHWAHVNIVQILGKSSSIGHTSSKSVVTRANWKPWLTGAVLRLLRARDKAFRAGDEADLRTARADLSRGIKEAKKAFSCKVSTHFKDSKDARSLWRGIQTITDYKPAPRSCEGDVRLLNDLNRFFARFDAQNSTCPLKTTPPPHEQPLRLSADGVRRALAAIDTRKAAGPDNIPGRALKDCAGELSGVFTDIFNVSLQQAIVPSCFKAATIVPVPKKPAPSCFNDYRPVALTPIIMKCFERLVMEHIKSVLPPTIDPFQFAYRAKRSSEDAICSALHSALTHLERKDSYVRLLFVDFSSAFNTIVPQRLICKLDELGLSTSLCNLDTGLPLSEASGSACWRRNLCQHHAEHGGPPGLRAQSITLHPADA
nr:uncharacterized protein LOC125969398 [Syngnathus scovelli]